MSDIPTARNILQAEVDSPDPIDREQIRKALSLMTRKRSTFKRGPVKSAPVTDDVARKICAMKLANPQMHNQDIAEQLGVNAGRVSEVLADAMEVLR